MKQRTVLNIPVDHPAFAGHFPGMPIVPGVVLLDEAVHAMTAGQPVRDWQIASVKFLSPVQPGAAVVIEHETQAGGSVRFDILEGERRIATGSISLGAS